MRERVGVQNDEYDVRMAGLRGHIVTAPSGRQDRAAPPERRLAGWMDAIRGMDAEDTASIITVVWATYAEDGWPSQLKGWPTASEWKALRRWARTWIRQQDTLRRRTLERWAVLDSVPTEEIRRLAQFALQPETTEWPSTTMQPPETTEELALLRLALCMRPQQWTS